MTMLICVRGALLATPVQFGRFYIAQRANREQPRPGNDTHKEIALKAPLARHAGAFLHRCSGRTASRAERAAESALTTTSGSVAQNNRWLSR